MRVVVSGASGFIGGHLVRALAAADVEVVALSRGRPVAGAAEWHAVDVNSPEARRLATRGEAIIHLAALSDASLSRREPFSYGQVNVLGTANLLEAARETGAFFVLASSQRVYQPGPRPLAEDAPLRPVDPYGYSKMLAELWLRMYREVYGLAAVVLRFFSVYGPGQGLSSGTSGVVSIFLHRAMAGEELWVDGDRRADLTYVGDVVRGITAALARRGRCRPVYNVATGIGTSMQELARLVLAITGSRSPFTVRPASAPGEGLVADITRAREDFGYAPQVELPEGLARTYDWLASRGTGAP